MQIYCLKAYIHLKQLLFYHRIFSEIGVKSNYYVVYFIFISCVHACTSLEKNSSSLIIVLFISEYVYTRGEMNSYKFEILNRCEISSVHVTFCAYQNDPTFWWTCVGISFRVAFTWYFITQNFISVKTTDMKSIPAMCFKRTLNAICNESALIHFVSGKVCSHENLMPV